MKGLPLHVTSAVSEFSADAVSPILEQPDDLRHLFNVEVISQRLTSPSGLPGRFREGSIFIDCVPRKLRCREVTLSNRHIDVKVVA